MTIVYMSYGPYEEVISYDDTVDSFFKLTDDDGNPYPTAGHIPVAQSDGTFALEAAGNVNASTDFGTDNRIIRSNGTAKVVQASSFEITDGGDQNAKTTGAGYYVDDDSLDPSGWKQGSRGEVVLVDPIDGIKENSASGEEGELQLRSIMRSIVNVDHFRDVFDGNSLSVEWYKTISGTNSVLAAILSSNGIFGQSATLTAGDDPGAYSMMARKRGGYAAYPLYLTSTNMFWARAYVKPSQTTNSCASLFGFASGITANLTARPRAMFSFNPNTSSYWQCISSDASTDETTTTTVSGGNTEALLELWVEDGRVEFWINETSVATHTTTYPTTSTGYALAFRQVNTTGAIEEDLYVYSCEYAMVHSEGKT